MPGQLDIIRFGIVVFSSGLWIIHQQILITIILFIITWRLQIKWFKYTKCQYINHHLLQMFSSWGCAPLVWTCDALFQHRTPTDIHISFNSNIILQCGWMKNWFIKPSIKCDCLLIRLLSRELVIRNKEWWNVSKISLFINANMEEDWNVFVSKNSQNSGNNHRGQAPNNISREIDICKQRNSECICLTEMDRLPTISAWMKLNTGNHREGHKYICL